MAPPIGRAFFPGVERVISCSATLSHGITPGVINLTIAPQDRVIADGGTLLLAFGNSQIAFGDCKIDSGSVMRNGSGRIVSLSIFDRRWKWTECGQISGSYNLRNDDGTVIEGTGKTPQELARLCLDAMGESGYDVGDIPNEARPTVEWEVMNPAQALADLCDQLGCRVVPQIRGHIAIRRVGVGSPLPPGPVVEYSATVDPPEKPDAITVVFGPTRYQMEFELEAVGLNEDGTIAPIAELEYADGIEWGDVSLATMDEVGDLHGQRAEELAKATVYRWYRIKMPATVPDYGEVDKVERFLPIEQEQVDTILIQGRKVNKPAEVSGTWYPVGSGEVGNVETTVDRNFQIDTVTGIVKFSEPIYAIEGADDEAALAEPTLTLKVAVSVRDKDTRSWDRHIRTRKLGGPTNNTQDRYERHDEITLNFDSSGKAVNGPEVDKEADYYLDALERSYFTADPSSATYAGLFPIELDGALQCVTWKVGGGAFTTIQRNQDLGSPTTIPYKNRRNLERKRGVEQNTKKLSPQQLRKEINKARVL